MRDYEELGRILRRPARRLNLAGLGILLAGSLLGGLAIVLGSSRIVAIAVADGIVVLGIGLLWMRFLDDRIAPAYEAILHHDLIERAAWRRTTGSSMPRTRVQARRWLREHPQPADPPVVDLLRRAMLHTWIEDAPGARSALARAEPETPVERFARLVEGATVDCLDGRPVELQPIREAFLAIDEQAERRLRRICLGMLEARLALLAGGDTWAPLLAARHDVDRVAPAATLRAVTARVFALVVVLAGLAAVVLTFVGR